MSRSRRSKQERRERRHARAENAKKTAGKAARATGKGFLLALVLALVPGIGATACSYVVNQRAKANELKIEARGIARVAQRDLNDAATALAAYKDGEKLPTEFWTPIAASDLQHLASNLKSGEWRRFGCAAKTADELLIKLRSGSRPARESLDTVIDTITQGAGALREVSGDPTTFGGEFFDKNAR